MKNISKRILILKEEIKFEDEKQEVLYSENWKLFGPWPKDKIEKLKEGECRELYRLKEKKMKEELEVSVLGPDYLSWNTAEETEKNLKALLEKLKRGNSIVERIVELWKFAAER